MKTTGIILGLLLAATIPTPGLAQGLEPESHLFRPGLTVSTGMGRYSIRDGHLSQSTYSGTQPFMELRWVRLGDGRGDRMSVGVRAGGDVRNHSLSTDGSGVTLDYEAVRRIGAFPVLGREATVYLGPAAGASISSIGGNPVDTGDEAVIALSALISAGAVSGVAIPLTSRLSAVATGRLDPFSVGLRIVERKASDPSSETGHRAARATYGAAGMGLRYRVDESVSFGLGYFTDFLRIDSWDYLGVSTSRLVFSFSLHGWDGGES